MKRYRLYCMAALVAAACGQNKVEQEIARWNASFSAQKIACEQGNGVACRKACEMSRAPTICKDAARLGDMSNPAQKEWVDACPLKALEDGKSCCEKAATLPASVIPMEAPVPASAQPVAAKAVVQNAARFERINARGTLRPVGLPVVQATEGPGPAYFATDGSGLVRLDGAGFQSVVAEPGDLSRIAPGSDGTLWLLSYNAVHRLDRSGAFKSFQGAGQSRGFDLLTVAPNGDVWTAGLYGISRFDGNTWSLYTKDALTGKPHTTIRSLAADSDGRVWAAAHEAIYVFEAGEWRVLEMNGAAGRERPIYLGPAVVARNQLLAGATGGLLRISTEDWLRSDLGGGFSINHLVFRNDTLYAASFTEIRVVPPDADAPIRKLKGEGKDFPSSTIKTLAADNRGRIWTADDDGPTVVTPSGAVTHWPFGSVDALRGRVNSIYVVGDGPELPASVEPVKRAPIHGRLVRNGKPAVGAKIEICPSAAAVLRRTPCEGQPFTVTAVTDANGKFRIDAVPLGAVQIGFREKDAEKWIVPMGSCCGDRDEGVAYDIGDIEAEKGSAAFLFKKR